MRKDGEPSVEEILASIKKVIGRDNRQSAADLRRVREEAGMKANDQAISEDDEDEDDVLDLGEDGECLEAPDYSAHEDNPLLADAVRASMRDSLDVLAVMAEPGARPQIVRSGETSLEGLVREMLRPMLAEWLEKNLPAMVERMVAAEIARIAGKRG